MRTPRGKGFVADDLGLVAAQHISHDVAGIINPGLFVPGAVSWRDLVRIDDQGVTASCVGQAFRTALSVTAAARGASIAMPSASFIYALARLIWRPNQALFDSGCRPTDAIDGMMRYGIASEERWPFQPAEINVLPPLDVYMAGSDAMLTGHLRVRPGKGAAGQLRQAISSGYIPTFAMHVDSAFEELEGDTVVSSIGVSVGQHMQAIVGYDRDVFLVAGSWGKYWADGGFVRLSESLIEDESICNAFLIPTVLPLKVT